jgi:hypothetical protein
MMKQRTNVELSQRDVGLCIGALLRAEAWEAEIAAAERNSPQVRRDAALCRRRYSRLTTRLMALRLKARSVAKASGK